MWDGEVMNVTAIYLSRAAATTTAFSAGIFQTATKICQNLGGWEDLDSYLLSIAFGVNSWIWLTTIHNLESWLKSEICIADPPAGNCLRKPNEGVVSYSVPVYKQWCSSNPSYCKAGQ